MSALRSIAIDAWSVRVVGDASLAPRIVRGRSFALPRGGYVHEALFAAGVIPAIDAPGGEDAQSWIGRVDWEFVATFEVDHAALARRRVELCFDWIDTVAEVRLNGCRAATSANEFVPLRAAAKAWLREGTNEIVLRIRGPVAAVESLERRLGPRPVNGDWTPFSFLRKCASNFGWDWGPRAASAGLGGSRLECYDGPRIAHVRPLVTSCGEHLARLEIHVECELADGPVEARALLVAPDERRFAAAAPTDDRGRATLTLDVPEPHRWWPRGFGRQPLHLLHVELAGGAAPIARRVGLRTVALRTEADRFGVGFVVEVNGVPVWCRGANWVPRAPLPRVRPAAAEALERMAADAHCNMLRVWGGGVYEDESFYDRCDELGILVWQDFMFACATYPEERAYLELVEAEARHHVARLSSHPCVALWCGGNEDILAWWSWGWKERLRDGQAWGRRYWLELLPRVVRELDPTRPYWPESPYSGSMDVHPNDPDRGDRHTWDAKLEGYRTIVPRFCSEFGHQSPPNWESICAIVPDAERAVGCAELAARQRAWGGDAFQYAPHLDERFAPIVTLEAWTFAAQLLQARAYELAIVWMRANAPRCMGALFWQLNDVWTGHSWSVIDARGLRKPSYHAVARACAPLAIGIVPDADGARVVMCAAAGELGATERPRELRLRLVDAEGAASIDDVVPIANESEWVGSARVPGAMLTPREPQRSLLVADCGGLRATHAFVHDKAFAFAPQRCEAAWSGTAIVVRSSSLLRDACLPASFGPRDGVRTLLPGETWSIATDAVAPSTMDVAALVRSANWLGFDATRGR